jgi:transcriptional regulator GlxA family with amidase domain
MTPKKQDKKVIAFVVYPGCTLLELVGAYHMLFGATMMTQYQVVAVGERLAEIETDTPMKIVPQKTFADVPAPYALIVLGSGTRVDESLQNQPLLDYVRSAGAKAQLRVGISSGSLILARAGLVGERRATTHWQYAAELEQMGGHYVRQPWVEDGNLITAAGVSGAIDVALYLVARLTNEAKAKQVQFAIEYDPHPPFGGIDWSSANGHGNGKVGPANRGTLLGDEKTIALVIYQGLTVFDLVGPLQVYIALSRIDPRFRVEVLAERLEPIKTDLGIQMLPTRTFADVPHPHVMIVPGGDQPTIAAMLNPVVRRYVRQAAETAEIAGSVCTGALILAGSGLLAGRPATTHWAYRNVLNALGARYQRQRWVQDDKFIMSAGVSAGIDTSLYIVSKLTDEATARQVQLAIGYDPQPPFGGLDYEHMGMLPRVALGFNALRAPFIAARSRRLARQGI